MNKLMLLLQSGILSIVITSCTNNGTASSKQSYTAREDTGLMSMTIKMINFQDSLAALYNANTIDAAHVGYAGVMTVRYKSYQWLVNHAPDSLLRALTSNRGKYISTYAFMALCERNPSAAKQIIKAHLHDTTAIRSFSGCIVTEYPLNYFWLMHLKDNINKKEYAALEKEAGIEKTSIIHY